MKSLHKYQSLRFVYGVNQEKLIKEFTCVVTGCCSLEFPTYFIYFEKNKLNKASYC